MYTALTPAEKYFLRQNKQLIEENKFDTLFKHARKQGNIFLEVKHIFSFFYSHGINPLNYMFSIEKNDIPDNVETIVLPKNVRTIGDGAFHNCKQLKSVVFDGVIDIGSMILPDKTDATISLPKTLMTINELAFYNYSGELDVQYNETVEHFHKYVNIIPHTLAENPHGYKQSIKCKNGYARLADYYDEEED